MRCATSLFGSSATIIARTIPRTPAICALISVCLCAALCVQPRAATAAPPTDEEVAFELITRANAHWKAQEYQESLPLYERAYTLTDSPDVLYRIGQVYERLERYDRARKTYETYLARVPDNPYAGRIRTKIRQLEQIETPIQPATLTVATTPQGATVLINGEPLEDPSPVTKEFEPGTYRISVRLEGYNRSFRIAELREGEAETVSIEMVPLEPERPEPEPEPEQEAPSEKNTPPPKRPPTFEELRVVDTSAPTGVRVLAWIMVAPGTGMLIVGLLGLSTRPLNPGPFTTLALGGAALVGGSSFLLFRDWGKEYERKEATGSMRQRELPSARGVGVRLRF